MTHYYLRRGREWICVPEGCDQTAGLMPGLTVCSDPDRAWLSRTIDEAHERQALVRLMHGWSTEIRAIQPD